MNDYNKILYFIIRARERFNLQGLLGGLCGGLMVASVGMFLLSIGFVIAGYAVDRKWLLLPFFAGAVFAAAWYYFSRVDILDAAAGADKHFDLKDSLVSAEEFHREGKTDGIYDLQAKYAAMAVAAKNVKDIKFQWPRKWLILAFAVLVLAAVLCTLEHSLAVRQRLAQEQQTAERSDEIAKYLKKEYEELEKKLDKKQKELLKKSGLKKKINELGKTKDRKEALRKLGKIEKQFRKLSAQAAARKDEKFLKRLAKKMSKGKNTKKLGAELAAGKFAKAAKTLKNFKASKLKNKKKTPEEIAEMMKKLARQMQEAEDSDGQQGDVEKAAKQFAQAAEEIDPQDSDCDKMFEQADGELDEMSEEMESLGEQMEFSDMMQEMAEKLGQSQNFCMGMGKRPGNGMGKKPGMGDGKGKKPGPGIGSATAGNKRKGDGKKDPSGKTTRIKGRKGRGPSTISISEASSGSGVSGRVGDAKKASAFKSQVESFVHREDVPENLKGGVKKYFEIIHQENISRDNSDSSNSQ